MPVSAAITLSGVLAAGATAAQFASYATLALVLSLASYGLSTYATLKLKERAEKATDTVSGTQEALPVVYGTRRIGGRVVDARVDDTSNDRKRMDYVVAFSVGPEQEGGVNGITRVWLDDTLAIDGGGGGGYIAEGDQTGTETAYGTTAGVQKDPYNPDDPSGQLGAPFLAYNFFTGTDDQSMPQFLKDTYTDWDSDSDLKGIAVLHLSMWWHEDVWKGVPDVEAEFEGNPVLDPRTDQITFDVNPIICGLDYAMSRKYGMGMDGGNMMGPDAGAEHSGTSSTYHTYFSNKSISLLGLEVGDNVSVAADLKSATGADTTRIVLEVYDSTNTLLDTQTQSVTSSTYSRVSIENYGLPSSADNITLYAENVDLTETAYARRVSFVQSSTSIGYYERFNTDSITSEASFCENTNNVNITTPNRFSINSVIETSRSLRTNMQEIMASCRGQLLYDMGTLRFHIPRSKTVESYVVDEDDIIGDYSWKRQGIKETSNAIVASYVDAEHSYQARDKKWPEPGRTNVSLKEEDSGFRNVKSIDLPHTTSREMAGRIAQILFNEVREDVTVSFRATPEMLRFNVGDVVKHSHDAEGWTEKEFWVANMGLNPDGTVTVGLNEYNSNAYNVSNISTDTPVPGTDLPGPTPNNFRIFDASVNDDGTVYTNVWGDKATESIEISYNVSGLSTHTVDATKTEHTTTGTLAKGQSVTITASLYASTGTSGRPLTDSIQVSRSGAETAAGIAPDIELVRGGTSTTTQQSIDVTVFGGVDISSPNLRYKWKVSDSPNTSSTDSPSGDETSYDHDGDGSDDWTNVSDGVEDTDGITVTRITNPGISLLTVVAQDTSVSSNPTKERTFPILNQQKAQTQVGVEVVSEANDPGEATGTSEPAGKLTIVT